MLGFAIPYIQLRSKAMSGPAEPASPSPDIPVTPGLIGWYDVADTASLTLSGTAITAVANRSGNSPDLVFSAGPNRRAPVYLSTDPLTGKPAMLFSDDGPNSDGAGSFLGLGGSEQEVQEMFIVLRYRQGTEDSYALNGISTPGPISSGLSGLTSPTADRIIGQGGANRLYAANASQPNLASKNGAAFSSIILPTGPLSILRFSATQEGLAALKIAGIGACYVGGSDYARSASLDGIVCEIALYDQALTTTEVTSIETYLAQKWL